MEPHPTAIHAMRRASIGLSVRVYLNFEVFGSVMVASWLIQRSDESSSNRLGVQIIQNQLDGVVQNKVVYVRVLQERGYEFSWKQCHVFSPFCVCNAA